MDVKEKQFTIDSDFLYHSLMSSTSDYIYLWDVQNDIFKLSQNTRIDFGINCETSADFIPEWMGLVHAHDLAHVQKVYNEFLVTNNTSFSMEYQIKNKDNHYIWLNTKGFIKRDKETNKPLLVMGVMRNLEYSGSIDAITGLPKYENCKDRYEYYAQQHQSYEGTMLLLGIDNFNSINTLNNHAYGDLILRRIAQDIVNIVPNTISVYRFESDQFLVVAENIGQKEMLSLYDRINSEISNIRQLDNQLFHFTISAGLLSFPENGKNWSDLEKGLSVALKKAKENGKNQCVTFTKALLQERVFEQTLTYYLVQSIENGFRGFHVVYQPVCISNTLKLKGAEALLRFETPNNTHISPVEFIPLLENSKLIIQVGLWVLEEAIKTCKEWISYIPGFVMNVNVSYIQLRDASFCNGVQALLSKYDLPVENLILELTESYFMSNDETINESLKQLKGLKLRLAMDDFGTGYSTLGQLSKFNVDIVKIDRLFVQALHKSKYNRDFVESVIKLCHNVGMRVCVEGVETREEQEIISMLDSDFIQGFYVSKPIEKETFYKNFILTPYDNESLVVTLDKEKERLQFENDKALLSAMMKCTPLALIFWNHNGEVIDCNEETLALFGVDNAQELIQHIDDFSPEYQPDGIKSEDKLKIVLHDSFENKKHQFSWLHCKKNGELIPCEIKNVIISYLGEKIIAATIRDISDQIRLDEKGKRFNTKLKALLDASPLCLNLWEDSVQVVMCNQEAVNLFHLNSEQEYLDNFFALSPKRQPDGKLSVEAATNHIKEAMRVGKVQFQWMHRDLKGNLIPAEITLIKIEGLGENGGDVVAGYTRDLREQMQIESKNKKFTKQLKALLDSTPLCLNLWNAKFENTMCNKEAVKLFDLHNEQEYLDRFFELSPMYQPDGRLSSESSFQYIEEALHTGRSQFNWTHCKLDGELIPAEITLVRVDELDEDNGVMVAGYTRDLRTQLELERKEKVISRRIRAVVDATPLACILLNMDEKIIDCNEIATLMFGVEDKQKLINNFAQFNPLHQPDGAISAIKEKEKIKEVKASYHSVYEWIFTGSNKEEIPCEVTLARMKIEEAEDIIVAYCRDLRELKKTLDINERLEKLAHYDSLTGCMSRIFFMDSTSAILAKSEEKDKLSLSIFDLDSFKNINDTYGHKAGDITLKAVVKKISSLLPPGGLLGRYGGDEFLLFFKNMDKNEISTLLNKAVACVNEMEIHYEDTILKISISTGTTLWKGHDNDCEVLLRRADLALYEAKRSGGNRVVIQ